MDEKDPKHPPAGGDVPDDLSPKQIRSVLSRARLWAILRTGAISLVSAALLLAVFAYLDQHAVNGSAITAYPAIARWVALTEPDVRPGDYHFTMGLAGGQIGINTYKVVGGIPIPWHTEQFAYGLTGTLSPAVPGDYSPSPQIPATGGNMRLYDPQTEQPIMQFYLPGAAYAHTIDDLSRLSSLAPGVPVELALSFNHPYSFSAVNRMLPPGLKPAWYWVDTYTKAQVDAPHPPPYLAGGSMFGFSRVPNLSQPRLTQTPKGFIAALQGGLNGPFASPFAQAYRSAERALERGTGTLGPKDVTICGVVVTATPKALSSLQGQPYIRAAVLGAAAHPA